MDAASPQTLLFASTNKGKLTEVRRIGSEFGLTIIGPHELQSGAAGFSPPGSPAPDVDENAPDYLGNARLKAEGFFRWCGLPSLADDTGLEVDALGGEPGLYSARYAGPGCSGAENIKKLLRKMEGETNRSARFFCVLYLQLDPQNHLTAEAVLEGSIRREPHGSGGFGYDSVFEVAGQGLTLAEIKEREMPFKTHRILACEQLLRTLTLG